MKSRSFSTAILMKLLSFSVSEGRQILTPGRFTLFLEPNNPPSSTTHSRRSPFLLTALRPISPSSIRISQPSGTSSTNFLYDTFIRLPVVFSPGFPAIITLSPFLSSTGASHTVVLISGPFVSIRMAILSDTVRTFLTILRAPSASRCAELILTTSIPAW